MKLYLENNIISISIILFVLIYSFINYLKPSILYNKDSSLMQFGLNNSKRTIIPAWLLAFILAILSYVFTKYVVNYVL